MSTFDPFLPKVMQVAAGAPEPLIIDALRAAAIEFCERTRLWRDELTCDADTNPVQVVPHDVTPDANKLTLPADSELFQVDRIFFDDRELDPKDVPWLDDKYPLWRTGADDTGVPQYVTQLELDTLFLVPSFTTGEVRAFLWLKPTEGAATLPDFLAAKYREVIAWGALGRLLAIDKQPFSNPNLAVYYADKFNSKLSELSSAGSKGQQRAPLRVKPHYF